MEGSKLTHRLNSIGISDKLKLPLSKIDLRVFVRVIHIRQYTYTYEMTTQRLFFAVHLASWFTIE